MESFGPVVNLEYSKVHFLTPSIKKNFVTRKNTGIGFCEFCDQQTAEQALKMNNKKVIDGRPLRIDNPDGGKKGKTTSVLSHFVSSRLGDRQLLLLFDSG